MARPKKYVVPEIAQKFIRQPYMIVDGFEIIQGDIVKIRGEVGARFKFNNLVTNIETGSQWVDCFETWRGTSGVWRSFRIDRIKRIPKRGKRSKRVN